MNNLSEGLTDIDGFVRKLKQSSSKMAKEENKRAKDCPDSHSLIKGQYDGIHDQKFMAIKQRITIANG